MLYYDGKLQDSSLSKAFNWMQRAADAGQFDAEYALGIMYRNGEGTVKNAKEGLRLITKAANEGNPNAMCTLGLLYKDGDTVNKDFFNAYLWLRRALRAAVNTYGPEVVDKWKIELDKVASNMSKKEIKRAEDLL